LSEKSTIIKNKKLKPKGLKYFFASSLESKSFEKIIAKIQNKKPGIKNINLKVGLKKLAATKRFKHIKDSLYSI
jgi:hypothetical protein